MRASTEREKTLIKQAEDELMLDVYLILSDDPAGLAIDRYPILSKLISDARLKQAELALSS